MDHRTGPPIDDARFVSLVNQAWEASGLDRAAPPVPTDPGAVAAWAGFLTAAVARGVAVGDPRWSRLEIRRSHGRAAFYLPQDPDEKRPHDEPDFGVGLALLMSLLGRSHDDDPMP